MVKIFKNTHSAVEFNINELEHHGLNRCPDKGLTRFKTYSVLAVLTYKLKKFGKILLKRKRIKEIEKAELQKVA